MNWGIEKRDFQIVKWGTKHNVHMHERTSKLNFNR